MKKTLTALIAAVLLVGCLVMLPGQTVQTQAATSTAVSAKARITKQPASATVFTGSKIKVNVKATGKGLKYKWYYKDKGSKKYKVDKKVTGRVYSRTMTSAMDGRKIYCKVTDRYGNTVKSKTVTLSAMVTAKIKTQPKSVKVYSGSAGTVKVKAEGDELIYKWYYKDKGEKSYKLDKNVTGSTYNRIITKAMNGRKVYCKITDAYGNTVKSKTVTITVRNKATVTKQPASTAAYSGSFATVKLSASGDGITYTWYFKDAGAKSFKKTTSFKGDSYKLKMTAANDGRQVYCVVKDKYGNKVTTKTVTLSTMVKASITKQPASVGVYNGSAISVKVTAAGDGLTYQWYYKDTSSSSFKVDSGMTGATYSRNATAAMNGRKLYCKVTDKYGNTVQSGTVTVTVKNKAAITAQPDAASIYSGTEIPVAVKATGDGLSYKWYYKDKSMSSYKQDTGITDSTYNRTATSAMNGRKLYCKVTDKYGNSVQTSTVTLTVKNRATLTAQPANAAVYVGDKIPVTVKATGDGLSYKWYWRTSSTTGYQQDTSVTGSAYNVTMTAAMNGRQIYCRITDKYGNTVSSNTVTITAKNRATLTAQPADSTVFEGASGTSKVSATGDGLTYQWYYKDTAMTAFKVDSGVTDNKYNRVTTAAMNGRQVYCVVKDKYGNSVTSNTVTLTVKVKAAITSQPQIENMELWQTATVSFGAKGDGLTYEWYIKDQDSSGTQYTKIDVTEDTYSFEVTVEAVGRRVYCVITDVYGNKAVTNTVTVTADVPATILKQPVSVHCALGEAATFTVTAAGDGATCVWEQKAVNQNYFQETSVTGSVFHIGSLTADFDGLEVRCKVTDKYGNYVYSDAVVISTKPYYIAEYNGVKSVELLGKEFATTDLVNWEFEKVGTQNDTDYGFAEEVITQKQASVRGLDFGDGTYLTKYVNVTEEDVTTLIGFMKQEGFTLNSESAINSEVFAYTLIGPETKSTITYVKHLKEMYVTVSNTMVYSPLLQKENFSTQSARIEGAQTKLHMLPTVNGGDCYVIQLKNGNFIVFDGDSANTLPSLLEFLQANTPEGKIPVVEAWFITHGHFDHCGWVAGVDESFADKVRVEGLYYNETSEQIQTQTVFTWRSDTATTGWRDKNGNPWARRVRPAVAKMKTSTGETTQMYRQQTGQIYYFCGLQVEIVYTQEQINFCDYQMDINASTTWHLVRSEEGNTFLDAGDTENVNMDDVIEMYSSDYDIYAENLDIMSIFHHGHNLYAKYRNIFRAPILFLPSAGPRSVNAQATTVYRYFITKPGTYYTNSLRTDKVNRWSSSSRLKDGLGLPVYHYGDGIYTYNFATNTVTKYS